ncbi:hypothetical protein SAMN04488136_10545 [Vibrio xiamenensis]|uniref:DUF4870 domain-containing protein n=1 Tax=Vibrio xiamenensis TaxID=861298 RepID=A0A1G7YCJ8_9VIBR|nr:hypothetical protein [Vibrio xiamenensis]SDG94067.1 hypothetical protein SAMN04488136_10545 [Vibrio xiamenensis]
MSDKQYSGVKIAYWLSILTPFTCLISGVIAIIYAGYRLDKGEDGEVVNSHYYGLIRSFFLNLTFFVVLIISVATANGLLKGVNNYWYKASWIDSLAMIIPYIGMIIGAAAIFVWFVRMKQGMDKLRNHQPMAPSTGPNL